MPEHTDFAVTVYRIVRTFESTIDGKVLMVSGKYLGGSAFTMVKADEVMNDVQQTLFGEYTMEEVVKFLKEEGVTALDALIITHYDKDHMGGASLILEQFNVARVLVPDYEYTGNRPEYDSLVKSMNATSIQPEAVAEATEFSFGETTVLVEPPVDYDVDVIAEAVEDFDNTMSLFTTVTCGEKKFLFTGDADRRRINEWLQHTSVGDVDFLKVPHHGLFNASMEALIEATKPEYAAITCSKKNPADDFTIELLVKHGVNVFQTRDGRITAVTDGKKLEVKVK